MNITEIKNDIYKINAVHMANDARIKNVVAPLNDAYGFFILLVGKPASGKTTFWINLINKKSKNTYYKKFDQVYVFSKSLDTITEKIKLDQEHIFDSIDELEDTIEHIKTNNVGPALIILDDLVCDIKDPTYILQLIYNRRHLGSGISIIITSQVYNKIALSIRKCCTDLILFSTNNKRELASIYDDFVDLTKQDYYDVVRYCFKSDNHQFIWLDTSKNIFYHNFNLLKLEHE